MRTNIVIDDMLMRDTLRATGLKTKRDAVTRLFGPCSACGDKRRSAGCAANSTGRATSTR